ncbi:FxSxx-COOH system tetratricopeptide repeat protein [Streptomyces sp. HNM0663]|uniref:FxSxx-COOH system tetratricopeptide repeat protein n=1 Tax=Streptomyces chengmaiensis TaxID=3040919 RepID=A0ABT6HZ38_9ACTN|nr:FxSxx-COOH system tetratricopeptide repeat protein [Streptomyces chengmaiensis]MDH2393983.1 FxSxx-COOH system tetratricopeptide repeat protein [Streptomyces chengmaiensis]
MGRDAGQVVTGDGATGVHIENIERAVLLPEEAITKATRHERSTATPAYLDLRSTPLAVPQRRVASDRLRGRDDLLATLTGNTGQRTGDSTDNRRVDVLTGLGGCGKTTVALEVAHRLSPMTGHVWWVSAADRESLWVALHAVAFDAGADSEEFAHAHAADVLWKRLNALTEPWLLVLDNVDDPSFLTARPHPLARGVGWLRPPGTPHGTVLVTSRESRRERWAPWIRVLPVDVLGIDDGARVLLDLAPEAGDEREAKKLAQHLGGLPLALDLAGSYLALTAEELWPVPGAPETFADYRRSFDGRIEEMAADPDSSLGEAEQARRAILTTWELSLDLLHNQGNDLARPLLRLLSAFGPAPIPHQQLLNPQVLATCDLFPTPTDKRIRAALKGLSGLRLVNLQSLSPEPDRGDSSDADIRRKIDIHPLVRASNRAHADFTTHAGKLLDLVTALLERAVGPLEPRNPAHWRRWRHFSPHCTAPLHLLELVGSVPDDVTVAATKPALHAARNRNSLGLYSLAVTELSTVVALRESRLGPDHPATLESRLSLAPALRDDAQIRESEAVYAAVAEACERTLPHDHPYLQSARGGLARVLCALGQPDMAETHLRAVLEIRLRDPGPRSREALRTRHDIATVLHMRGLLRESADELREIRRAGRELFGHRDPLTLAFGTSLTRALRDAGEIDEAECVGAEVVADSVNVLGSAHPDTLIARHEQARIMRDKGRLAEAEAEFAEIWRINKQRFGEDHPEAFSSRHELATTLHLLGRPAEAADHFRAVLDANARLFGEDHPDVQTCRRNLALVLNRANEEDHTRMSLDEALAAEGDERDPDVCGILERFARPRLSKGDSSPPGGGGGYSEGGYSDCPAPQARPVLSYRAKPRFEDESTGLAINTAPLSPGTLHALATGRETRSDVGNLRAHQRKTRVLALRKILAQYTQSDTVPHIRQARALLVEADRVDPARVDELLLHPGTGRWMSRTLRELEDDSSKPDPGNLQALAATAGINADLSFTLRIPVREGLAVLPTLGFADLGTDRRTTEADVVAENGYRFVRAAGKEVRLPSPSEAEPPGWHPVRCIKAHTAGETLQVRLDDTDPYRGVDPDMVPCPLTPGQADRWQELLGEAWNLLVRTDGVDAGTLAAALTTLTPQAPAPGAAPTSLTSSDAYGGIVLTEPEDALQLAQTLVHEFRHMKLHAILDMVSLHSEQDSGQKLFYAPWRDDRRPFEGLFQGVFAFFGVAEFWHGRCLQSTGDDLRRAQFELAYWRIQVWEAFTVVRSSPQLTGEGRQFVAAMALSAETWRAEPAVPADVAAKARAAALAHRARWELLHGRP